MPLGESHGASHFADGRFVELADRLPLELGHIAVERGGHQAATKASKASLVKTTY